MKQEELFIRFKIPFIGDPDTDSREYLIFHKWLPLTEAYHLCIDLDDGNLIFWLDIESTWWASQPDENEIKKWVNITAHYVYADLILDKYENDIVRFIASPGVCSDIDEKAIKAKKSEEWGINLLNTVLTYFNKLVSFARSYKGQYWLHEYPLDIDYYNKFEARARIGNSKWFRFDPIIKKSISIIMPSDYDRYFDKESWNQAIDFVGSETRPDLHLYLLSEAEVLQSKGNNRAALTEAIAALEVMIHTFSRDPRNSRFFSEELKNRLGLESLQSAVTHLGISASINYLVPLIFDEDKLPLEIIKDCQEAIMIRGNVVHQGQRDVDQKRLRAYIKSIRILCKILDEN